MNKFRLAQYLLIVCLAVFAGCSSAPVEETATTEPEPPPEPIEGQRAFYQMYNAARAWSADAEALQLESVEIPEVPSDGALFGAWRAIFVSPSKGRQVVMNYSVVQSSGKFMKGVFQDHEEGYSAGAAESPFPAIALKVSSTDAYDTVMAEDQVKEYVAEHPDTPILFLVERTNRFSNPTWRLVWGTSVGTSDFSAFVDASTGDLLEISH